jgi:effector-binding domain-containing protein
MAYDIAVREASPRLVAAARGRATLQTLAGAIPPLFDVVYGYLQAHDIPHRGLNLILYAPLSESEFEFEACVEVEAPFAGAGNVRCLHTPSGRCAVTTHYGLYEALPEAHSAVRAWCSARSEALAGPNWEAYGHWNDDLALRRTDVYYLLRARLGP